MADVANFKTRPHHPLGNTDKIMKTSTTSASFRTNQNSYFLNIRTAKPICLIMQHVIKVNRDMAV